MNFSYKENIQFLRAVSVLLVFLYHLNLEFFSKGYLGVDVFFVISGYVITQSIFFNIQKNNQFNLLNFFKKRILRIIPNLIFILSVIFIFYQFFGPNNISLWNDYISSVLGFSNLYYLFSNKGYFYNIFDNPFAHTWSLGVEEQFYFLYPILIYFFFKNINNFEKKLRFFKILIFIIILNSLFFSIYYSSENPDLNFYFSPLRFWELGVGCVLFLLNSKIPKNQMVSNTSLILLIFIILIDINLPYIFYNLISIILAGLFISTNKKNFFLVNKFSLTLGKISYSFYLWHLPIIFFFNLYFESLIIQILLSFIFSFILSLMTFTYIERPFIEFDKVIKKILFFISSFVAFSLIFLVYIKITNSPIKYDIRNFIDKHNYLEKKYEWRKRVTFQTIYVNNNEIHENCDNKNSINLKLILNKKCLKKTNNEYLVFIEGDSHTAQFVNPINSSEGIKNIYFKFSPQKFVSEKLVDKISNEYKKIYYLRDINNLENLNFIMNSNLLKIDNLEFIFFNSTPFVEKKINVQRCLSRQTNCIIKKKTDIEKRNLSKLNNELKNLKKLDKRIYLFDSYNTICPKEYCNIYDLDKNLLYYMDNTHLSNEGSQMLQKDIEQFFLKHININNINK